MTMKLWLLKPIDEYHHAWGFDCAYGFVIRAETEEVARQLANGNAGDEAVGRLCGVDDVWQDVTLTTCEELSQNGPVDVILTDFRAG